MKKTALTTSLTLLAALLWGGAAGAKEVVRSFHQLGWCVAVRSLMSRCSDLDLGPRPAALHLRAGDIVSGGWRQIMHHEKYTPVPFAEHAADNDEGVKRMPGGQSRWSQGKDLSWEPLRPELVLEVAYDHMQGDRFRHTAQFRRWRSDKKPTDCTYDQLEVVPPQELAAIFPRGR